MVRRAHSPRKRTTADRRLDALLFVTTAEPRMVDAMTAEAIATRYGCDLAYVVGLLADRAQRGLGL